LLLSKLREDEGRDKTTLRFYAQDDRLSVDK
jgi:hypothetical protein